MHQCCRIVFQVINMTIKRVTVLLPESLHKQVKYLSVTNDTTMQKIILESIKLYLQNLNNVTENTSITQEPLNSGF